MESVPSLSIDLPSFWCPCICGSSPFGKTPPQKTPPFCFQKHLLSDATPLDPLWEEKIANANADDLAFHGENLNLQAMEGCSFTSVIGTGCVFLSEKLKIACTGIEARGLCLFHVRFMLLDPSQHAMRMPFGEHRRLSGFSNPNESMIPKHGHTGD